MYKGYKLVLMIILDYLKLEDKQKGYGKNGIIVFYLVIEYEVVMLFLILVLCFGYIVWVLSFIGKREYMFVVIRVMSVVERLRFFYLVFRVYEVVQGVVV